jgi:hypothetical protein
LQQLPPSLVFCLHPSPLRFELPAETDGCQGYVGHYTVSLQDVKGTLGTTPYPCKMSRVLWALHRILARRQGYFGHSTVSLHKDASDERCRDGGVGNALIHHSTLAECDPTHASYVDTRFACHSQVASQGTGAVNVRNADTAMH